MKKLLFIFICILNFKSYSQTFSSHAVSNISSNELNSSVIFSGDIDGDGLVDIVSSAQFIQGSVQDIVWQKSIDGLGNFGDPKLITSNINTVYSLYLEDIDGDGDLDLFSASRGDGKLVLYENLDGLGTFGNEILIDERQSLSVFVNDVDGDGDLDVLSSQYSDIVWYENLDGLGNFGTRNIIGTDLNFTLDIKTSDIDKDGDLDVFVASEHRVVWFENLDGQGTFGAENIISTAVHVTRYLRLVDVDNDGLLDVVYTTTGRTVWHKNINSQEMFGEQRSIGEESKFAGVPSDVDCDGDLDLIYINADGIFWIENNDGLGIFQNVEPIVPITNPYYFYTNFIHISDLDLDGVDDITVFFKDNGVTLMSFENPTQCANSENEISFQVYPNPAQNILTINSQILIAKIEVFNNIQKLLISNSNQNWIDISSLSQGVYFMKIEDVNGLMFVKKIIKE